MPDDELLPVDDPEVYRQIGEMLVSLNEAEKSLARVHSIAVSLGALSVIEHLDSDLFWKVRVAGDHLREADTLSRGRALAEARVAIAWGDLERLQGRVADAAERYGAAAPVLVAAAVADGPAALLRLGEVEAFRGADDEALRALQSARDAASGHHARAAPDRVAAAGARTS